MPAAQQCGPRSGGDGLLSYGCVGCGGFAENGKQGEKTELVFRKIHLAYWAVYPFKPGGLLGPGAGTGSREGEPGGDVKPSHAADGKGLCIPQGGIF